MNALLWVASLLLLGLGVMVLEVFVPSGGILGFVSIAALVAAVATAFLEQGATAGMMALAVVVVAVPAVLAVAFRWFPETPLGRRVLPPAPEAADVLPDLERRRHRRELVGHSGLAVSELLPWGRVEIDGETVEAMSEGGPIEAGAAVEAVGVQGTALVVRIVEPRAAAPRRAVHDPSTPLPSVLPIPPVAAAAAENAATGDGSALSPTLEEFEFDGLEPPAA
jgi:membrane-bound ClpP family serine protease